MVEEQFQNFYGATVDMDPMPMRDILKYDTSI